MILWIMGLACHKISSIRNEAGLRQQENTVRMPLQYNRPIYKNTLCFTNLNHILIEQLLLYDDTPRITAVAPEALFL